MMLIGFGGLGYVGYRKARGATGTPAELKSLKCDLIAMGRRLTWSCLRSRLVTFIVRS
jgi:hypothetical protein